MKYTERDIYDFLDRSTYPYTVDGEFRWRRFVILCVVSLFWDQTRSEQVHRMSHFKNDKGYNQADAPTASKWALNFLNNLPDDIESADDVLSLNSDELMLIPRDSMNAAVTMLGHYRKQLSNKLNGFQEIDYANELVAKQTAEMKKEPVIDDIKRSKEKINLYDIQPGHLDDDDELFSKFEKANVFEAAMTKNAKPDYLKRMEAVMRNDRIQNMKKPTVVPDKTKYDRKEQKKLCDMD